MKKLMFFGLVGLVSAFLFLSCSGSKSSGKAQGDITALEWRLVSVKSADGTNTLPPATGTLPTLLVNKEGKVSGTTGCNNYNGSITIDGYSIKFGKIAMTRKFCQEAAAVENAFSSALNATDNYTVENGDLKLKKGSEVLATLSSFR